MHGVLLEFMNWWYPVTVEPNPNLIVRPLYLAPCIYKALATARDTLQYRMQKLFVSNAQANALAKECLQQITEIGTLGYGIFSLLTKRAVSYPLGSTAANLENKMPKKDGRRLAKEANPMLLRMMTLKSIWYLSPN